MFSIAIKDQGQLRFLVVKSAEESRKESSYASGDIPLLVRRGGRDINKKYREASSNGADGEVAHTETLL